jgi:hypothetical protein
LLDFDLIKIKTSFRFFEQYHCQTIKERVMPMDVILVAAMTAAFGIFAITLCWADWRTRGLSDQH